MGSRVKVYNQSNSIYHNKFLIVDPCDLASDPLVETGSHNWSNAADTKNDENTLVIHDATIANLYYQSFAQNFADLNGVLSDCQILNDITDAESGNAIKLYPNPSTNGQWLVETPAEWLGAEAEIFDSNGRMVYRKTTNELKTSIQADIAKGVYIFKLTLQGNVFVQKVVKL
jgi:phosphatidylserine/phosphatidylglycerophosphate/cardiolipin synthase-like enzyme